MPVLDSEYVHQYDEPGDGEEPGDGAQAEEPPVISLTYYVSFGIQLKQMRL